MCPGQGRADPPRRKTHFPSMLGDRDEKLSLGVFRRGICAIVAVANNGGGLGRLLPLRGAIAGWLRWVADKAPVSGFIQPTGSTRVTLLPASAIQIDVSCHFPNSPRLLSPPLLNRAMPNQPRCRQPCSNPKPMGATWSSRHRPARARPWPLASPWPGSCWAKRKALPMPGRRWRWSSRQPANWRFRSAAN